MLSEMKKATASGSIALSSLPKELRPTLKVFDTDGDGTVGVLELA
jgi:Ca2+-binding EF-hand superfamily protein